MNKAIIPVVYFAYSEMQSNYVTFQNLLSIKSNMSQNMELLNGFLEVNNFVSVSQFYVV